MSLLVSILIPNYNKGDYINECLGSVLAQTYSHWECVVVDDHSTDCSWEIIESFANRDNRFRVCKRPAHLPKGGSVCRNLALSISSGQLVFYFDSDDVLAPFCLSNRVTAIIKNPGLDFWAFPTALFEDQVSDSKYLWNTDQPEESDLGRFLRMDVLWQTSGPIYTRGFIAGLGGFNTELAFWQDYDLHLKALLNTKNYKKFFELPPDVFIRNGDKNSLSRSTPFTSDLFYLRERIKFLESVVKNASVFVKLDESEKYSFSSLYYFFILQLWLKHGRYVEYREKWKYLCSKMDALSSYDPMAILEPFFLKLSKRAKSGLGLLSLLGLLKRKSFPDYKVMEKLSVGLVLIPSK